MSRRQVERLLWWLFVALVMFALFGFILRISEAHSDTIESSTHGSTSTSTPPKSTSSTPALVVTNPAPAVRIAPAIQVTPTEGAPTTTPPPATPDGPAWAQCPQWWSEARDVGWRESDLANMDRIMWRESRCIPTAANSAGANGLMQVMTMWADDCGGTRSDLLDPVFNLACARHVLAVQGWQAWSTS